MSDYKNLQYENILHKLDDNDKVAIYQKWEHFYEQKNDIVMNKIKLYDVQEVFQSYNNGSFKDKNYPKEFQIISNKGKNCIVSTEQYKQFIEQIEFY